MHVLVKNNIYNGNTFNIDLSKNNGLKISPRVNFNENEVAVNSLLLINQSFIEKVLKKKIKHKLDYYINYIISLLNEEDDSSTPERLSIALNDVAHYKSIIEYKYRKYLDDKYINLLLKKVDILEHELKMKIVAYSEKLDYYEEEKEIKGKAR